MSSVRLPDAANDKPSASDSEVFPSPGEADPAPSLARPRIRFTVSALMDVSFTAWNATRRFSAPISSRTLPTSACATASSTPGSNRAPRSSDLRRKIATRVS